VARKQHMIELIRKPVNEYSTHQEQANARKDLEPFIGSRHRVSEILNRKRNLTLDMIRRLHRGLGIPLEALISEAA